MIYNNNISLLGLGFMRHNPQDFQLTQQLVDYAMQSGINYFETCQFYLDKQCENIVTRALSKYDRTQYFLCGKYDTKGYGVVNLEEEFNASLRHCNTSYFDIYLLQALDRTTFENVKIAYPFFLEKKKEGKIKQLGFSFHDTQDILIQYLDQYDWDIVQIQINYYDWYLGDAKNLYQVLKERNLPIIAMGPFKGGTLTVKQPKEIQEYFTIPTLSHLAMHFLQTLSQIKIILTGAETLPQLKENVQLINNYSFSQTDQQYCKRILEYYSQQNQILCSGCKYCETVCPRHIPISKTFNLYNHILREPQDTNLRKEFSALTKSNNSFLNCIGCRSCEQRCPQHLPISQYLRQQLFTARL